MLMTSDLVDLVVLVNKLRSLMASYHHAPQLTTTSCLLFGLIPWYLQKLTFASVSVKKA